MSSSDQPEEKTESISKNLEEKCEEPNKVLHPLQSLEKSDQEKIGEVEAKLLKELVEMACAQTEGPKSEKDILIRKQQSPKEKPAVASTEISEMPFNQIEKMRPTEISSILSSEQMSLVLTSQDQSQKPSPIMQPSLTPSPEQFAAFQQSKQIQKAPLLHQQLIQHLASPTKSSSLKMGSNPSLLSSPSFLARSQEFDKRTSMTQQRLDISPSNLQRPRQPITASPGTPMDISQSDQLSSGRSSGEIPKSPLIGREDKRMKYPDRPITPQLSSFDHPVSPAGSSGSSKMHIYNRRRHSRLYPQFDNNHCLYQVHHCPDPVLPGTLYCIRHQSEIAQFYGQCSYIYLVNGHRCKNYKITRDDKNGLCELHATRISMRKKSLKRRPKVPETSKSLITKISKCVDKKKAPQNEPKEDNSLPPEDEFPERLIKMDHFAKFQTEFDSDPDYEDLDEYYPLRTAGYYTTEEIVKIYRSKLNQLKNLYMRQLEFLKFEYKEKRRLYLIAESEIAGSNVTKDLKRIVVNDEATAEYFAGQLEAQEETKALLSYHHKIGFKCYFHMLAKKTHQEQLAKENSKKKFEEMGNEEKRRYFYELTRKDGLNPEHSSPSRIQICSFSGNLVHCKERVLPLTKFCQAHILNDLNQKLFGACKRVINEDGDICGIAVLGRLDDSYCDLHKVIKVKDIPETEIERKKKLEWEEKLPEATLNDEIRILEEMVLDAAIDDKFLESEIAHILAKGLDKDDTSDSEEDDEDPCVEKPVAPPPRVTPVIPAAPVIPQPRIMKKALKRPMKEDEEEEEEEEEQNPTESDEDYIFEDENDELLDV